MKMSFWVQFGFNWVHGIKNGNNQYTERVETKFPPKTQSELADETGMTVQQLRKYKSLTDLIPELQDAVQSGQITATTAMSKKTYKPPQD